MGAASFAQSVKIGPSLQKSRVYWLSLEGDIPAIVRKRFLEDSAGGCRGPPIESIQPGRNRQSPGDSDEGETLTGQYEVQTGRAVFYGNPKGRLQ